MWGPWFIKELRGLIYFSDARMYAQPRRGARSQHSRDCNQWCQEMPRRMEQVHIRTCYVINEIHKENLQRLPRSLQPREPLAIEDTQVPPCCYVINRTADADRLESFMAMARQAGISVARHAATDWKGMNLHWMKHNDGILPVVHHDILKDDEQKFVKMRNVAIWNSHVTLWHKIKEHKTNQPVMIFEDDTMLASDFAEKAQKYIRALKGLDFDMAYSILRNLLKRYERHICIVCKNTICFLGLGHRPCRPQLETKII